MPKSACVLEQKPSYNQDCSVAVDGLSGNSSAAHGFARGPSSPGFRDRGVTAVRRRSLCAHTSEPMQNGTKPVIDSRLKAEVVTCVDSASDLGWIGVWCFCRYGCSTTYLAASLVSLKISPRIPDVSPGIVAYAGILLHAQPCHRCRPMYSESSHTHLIFPNHAPGAV